LLNKKTEVSRNGGSRQALSDQMNASPERNPPISVALDAVGALNLIAGALLMLSIIVKEYWLFGIGVSALVAGVVFIALGDIVRSLARANQQRERLLSQFQENA